MSKKETAMTTSDYVRFSYVKLVEAGLAPGATEKSYGMSVIIPKSATTTLASIDACIKAAIEEGKGKFGKDFGDSKKFKLPLRDGDEEREDAAYAKAYFLNANKKEKYGRPGMVDKKVQPILDPSEIKSGDYGHVSLNFYPFSVGGSKGVAVGLNHIQKVKDGDSLGGGTNAKDEFETIEFDDESNDIL